MQFFLNIFRLHAASQVNPVVSLVEIVINTKTVLETWFVVTIIVLTFGQMLILLMIAVFLREIFKLSDSIL